MCRKTAKVLSFGTLEHWVHHAKSGAGVAMSIDHEKLVAAARRVRQHLPPADLYVFEPFLDFGAGRRMVALFELQVRL